MLEKESLNPEEIAERLNASPQFVEAFLESSALLGLLEKDGSKFKTSNASSSFLVPGKIEYVGDLVLHITNYWHSWGNLNRLIVEGRTELPFENGFTDAATYWGDYMMGQHNRAVAGQGKYLVESVDLSNKRKMLDLGGGAASYSIALCGANPELNSTVIDQKEPLEVARPLVKAQGLENQITLKQGDFNTIDLGNNSDVVLISGVVLIKSQNDCCSLFQRAYDALVPGGMVLVQDFMRVDYSAERSFMDIMMDMYVKIAFDPEASDRHGDDYASWLTDAGFTNVKQIPLPTQLALITAEKQS